MFQKNLQDLARPNYWHYQFDLEQRYQSHKDYFEFLNEDPYFYQAYRHKSIKCQREKQEDSR